jgi:hypothetical protein
MGMDRGTDSILQLRDHFSRAVVRGRVGAEQNQHVDIELDGIATNLHVALFQDIEQADLN